MCFHETVVLRGTEPYHMEHYLAARGYTRSGCDVFVAEGIRICFVSVQSVALGSIRLTEVTLSFEGDKGLVQKEMAALRLQFMTAGG